MTDKKALLVANEVLSGKRRERSVLTLVFFAAVIFWTAMLWMVK